LVRGKNIPNHHKIYQIDRKRIKWIENLPNGHKIYQHLPLQHPPTFTQIGIFGLKTNHLAALVPQGKKKCSSRYFSSLQSKTQSGWT
jgi:hypothetical protein